ncbi:hypothetical protein RB653_008087 [Dictyostelium firmibasis]|uniref:FNIP repeat-containing protein n=1 Tax=Dictyostelium firmibasis TaxID=79012 RepID=A0AAN7YQV2_9MYCE
MFSFLKGSSKKSKETNVIKEDVEEEKEEVEEYSIVLSLIKKSGDQHQQQHIDNSKLFFKLFKNQCIKNQILNHCKLYKQYFNEKYQVQDYKEFSNIEEINGYISELNFKKIDPFLGFNKSEIKIPTTIKTISFSLDKQSFKDIQLPKSITTLKIGKYPKQIIIEPNDIPKHIKRLVLEEGFENQRTYSKTKYISTIPFIPSTIESLIINTTFFGTRVGEIPKTITTLDIGLSGHSRVFDKGYLPRDSLSLIDIKIGNCMNNQFLQPGDIPNSVKIIRFNNGFNQPLKRGIIPSSVTKVLFDKDSFFACPLEVGSFPSSVTEIQFGSAFNQEIKQGELPNGLITLKFGHFFNRDFILPKNSTLKTLILSVNFNLPLSIGDLPSSLENLEFGDEFNKPIPKGVIPPNLTYLKLSKYFQQQLKPGDLPSSIKTLIFGGLKLNESMLKAIPSSVINLKFQYLPTTIHNYTPFIQTITTTTTTLKHLEYFYSHDDNPIDFTKLPNGLKVTYSNNKIPKTIIINNN